MDRKKPIIFCGVERLVIHTIIAVAVGLDVFVDLVLNHWPQHRAIVHIPLHLKGLMDKIDHHFGFGEAFCLSHCQNASFGGKGRASGNLGGLPRF